jgi:predicted HTH transcriptional regulator
MTPEELDQLLTAGYERRGLEVKGARPRTDVLFFARVTRAALGMANHPDGGLIVIGVDEDANHVLVRTGLTDEQLATWNYDDAADGLRQAADPSIEFDMEVVVLDDRRFLVLHIHEFEMIPIICQREYQHQHADVPQVLRRGATYVRSRGKPETSEIPGQTEMRELLDLAIDKGLRAYLARSGRISVQLAPAAAKTEVEKFNAELEEPDA